MEEIGDLTKDMMLERADAMKSGSKKPKEVKEEPAETPAEETKP